MGYQKILGQLTASNCKLTPQRKEIIRTLTRAKTHLTAKQIFDRMRKHNLKLSLDTVYRNLAMLKELRVINQLDFQEGKSYFELNREQGHHHYLVCMKCGGTWKIKGCPMEKLELSDLPGDFKVTNHRFELFGYCSGCQS